MTFDESKHPREPAGTATGGEFAAARDSAISTVIAHGKATGNERGIFLDSNGIVLADHAGGPGNVYPDDRTETALRDHTQSIHVIHNHPGGHSLSGGDIGYLSKRPGVRAITAVTHDGRVYTASRGPKYPNTESSVMRAYDKSYSVEREKLLKRRDREDNFRQDDVDAQVDHDTMLSLHKRGIINYMSSKAIKLAWSDEAREASAETRRSHRRVGDAKRRQLKGDNKFASLAQLDKRTSVGSDAWWKNHTPDERRVGANRRAHEVGTHEELSAEAKRLGHDSSSKMSTEDMVKYIQRREQELGLSWDEAVVHVDLAGCDALLFLTWSPGVQ